MIGHKSLFNDFIYLDQIHKLPNKILLSGQKGIGKSTLAYHFINYVLSENQDYKYDIQNFTINTNSPEYKTIQNKTNTDLINIDVDDDKKSHYLYKTDQGFSFNYEYSSKISNS